MSCPDILWAIEAGRSCHLSTAERMVLITQSDRANGARICWPSMRCIGEDTGLSDRQVRKLVYRLAGRDLIRMELRGRLMHYFILREQRKPMPESDPDDGDNAEASSAIDPETAELSSAIEEITSVIAPDNAELSSGIALDCAETAEASSAIGAASDGEHRNSVPVECGTLRHLNAELSSAKPVQEEPIKEPKTRTSEPAREASVFSDSRLEGSQQASRQGKRSAATLEAALSASGMAADERANVAIWVKHQRAGDLPAPELARRLSFIRQRYPICGYRWLSKHVPAAAEIAAMQGWHAS